MHSKAWVTATVSTYRDGEVLPRLRANNFKESQYGSDSPPLGDLACALALPRGILYCARRASILRSTKIDARLRAASTNPIVNCI